MGWTIKSQYDPKIKKAVVIGAPHTSNWDFPLGVMALRVLGIKINIIAKHTLFFFPLGFIMRFFGAVPLDRKNSKNFVKGTAALFQRADQLWVGLSPEGTRKKVESWKTGFYYLAMEANVPIVFAYLDYEKKEMGIGEYIVPTGDFKADLQLIKNFYADKSACYPDKWDLEGITNTKVKNR